MTDRARRQSPPRPLPLANIRNSLRAPFHAWATFLLPRQTLTRCIARSAALLAAACAALPLASNADTAAAKPEVDAELHRLVEAVCDKQIVLLGEEAGHANGATTVARARVVRDLFDRCGFRSVLFESGIYDFLHYQAALATQTASLPMLGDAIGGLWSTAREMDAIMAWLHDKAMAGRLHVGGMDPNLGGATQLFAQRELPDVLAAALPANRRENCKVRLSRHTQWRYSATAPYNADEIAELSRCADEMLAAWNLDANAGDLDITARSRAAQAPWMARNVATYFAGQADPRSAQRARSDAMAANVLQHRAMQPPGTRIIVWTATVHAMKQPLVSRPGHSPMGQRLHAELGTAVAAIAFTAAGGQSGRPGQAPKMLAAAPADSLEGQAMNGFNGDLRYLGPDELGRMGEIMARMAVHSRPEQLNWSGAVDGVVVLRAEAPLTQARPATPWQLAR